MLRLEGHNSVGHRSRDPRIYEDPNAAGLDDLFILRRRIGQLDVDFHAAAEVPPSPEPDPTGCRVDAAELERAPEYLQSLISHANRHAYLPLASSAVMPK
jgi:hypothetical protein